MVELRQLRCLAAVVDEGTFTDAARGLGVSQAAVSRTVATLEQDLGVRLLRRTSREVVLTPAGERAVVHARRILAEADELVRAAAADPGRIRLGYAWAALGRHTGDFQRRWARLNPATEIQLVRANSPSAGLAEGACDLAVVRRELADKRFSSAIVGLERRMCAMASTDPLARRRWVDLGRLAERALLVDRRTGTTTPELWPESTRPRIVESHDIDDWLNLISSGRYVGVTSEATAHQYRRTGIVYRPVRDAEPIAVRLAWWRDDPHRSIPTVIDLISSLYRVG